MSRLLYQWYTDGEQLPVLQYRGDCDSDHTIQGAPHQSSVSLLELLEVTAEEGGAAGGVVVCSRRWRTVSLVWCDEGRAVVSFGAEAV